MKILTGFYNGENYIERCLKTIQSQTFEDWTCYITHDLSTDNSAQVVKDFIKDDKRFVLMPNNDKKLYQTGNFDTSIRYNKDVSDNEVTVTEIGGQSRVHRFARADQCVVDRVAGALAPHVVQKLIQYFQITLTK